MSQNIYKINETKVKVYMYAYTCNFPTEEAARKFVEQPKEEGYIHKGKETPK